MKLISLTIPNGDLKISALNYLPEGELRSTALIFSHGFTSGKYSLDSLASYLAGKGFEGVTYDFRGHKLGATGGEMNSALDTVKDLSSVLGWVRKNSRAERLVLIGHSMGAAASLKAASEDSMLFSENPERPLLQPIAGVACICIGLDPFKGFESDIGRSMLAQRADYVAGENAATILKGIEGMIVSASDLGDMPTLFIAAKQDVLISVARVEGLAALSRNSVFAQIESSHIEGPERSRSVIFQWLNQL